jgi:hypothetical protein
LVFPFNSEEFFFELVNFLFLFKGLSSHTIFFLLLEVITLFLEPFFAVENLLEEVLTTLCLELDAGTIASFLDLRVTVN